MLGTQVPSNNGNIPTYSWLTFKEVDAIARDFAAGCRALNLNPEVEAEGRKWRFLGI